MPDAGLVLHRLLAALYRDGPDTEWNSDMWETFSHILHAAELTYEYWPAVADDQADEES